MTATRTLLLFGDSNTHGTMPMADLSDTGRFGRGERWAGRLQELLPEWEVIAEGHPGRTTLHDDPVEGPHRNGLTVLPALLETHRRRIPEVDAFRLSDRQGLVRWGTDVRGGDRVSWSERPDFIEHAGGGAGRLIVGEPRLSPLSRKWVVTLTRAHTGGTAVSKA